MDARREPRPFPFERLRRVSRQRLSGLRQVARAMGDARPAAHAAAALLGAEVEITPLPLEHCPPGALGQVVVDPLVAVVLSHDSGVLNGRVAVELDPRFAAVVVDRALGGTAGVDAPVPVHALRDAERGALAYVAARLSAECASSFVVRGVVTSPASLAGVVGDEGATVQPARVRLGDDVGFARLWLPDRTAGAVFPTRERGTTKALARVPLDLVLEAAWGTLSVEELGALGVGDVVLLDESWLDATGDELRGSVRGRIAGARRLMLRCDLSGSTIVVATIDVGVDMGATKGTKMDTDTTASAAERAGDAPLEVSVEIARFTMTLAEIGALAPGEIVATGRAIGERVTLSANGVAVATGELVDVDGEVGVRILSLAT